jgi:hypothetical protein
LFEEIIICTNNSSLQNMVMVQPTGELLGTKLDGRPLAERKQKKHYPVVCSRPLLLSLVYDSDWLFGGVPRGTDQPKVAEGDDGLVPAARVVQLSRTGSQLELPPPLQLASYPPVRW